MSVLISPAKSLVVRVVSLLMWLLPKRTFSLATAYSPLNLSPEDLKAKFASLDQPTKNRAYFLLWETSRMHIPSAFGEKWGEEHFWDDLAKAHRVMQRVGVFGTENVKTIHYVPRFGALDKSRATYFSLEEKLGNDPKTGWISYVNGLRTNIWKAGEDAKTISSQIAEGKNIHSVHVPSRQEHRTGDLWGFILDSIRHLAVEGGAHTRASCLIVQQWIEYLDDNPGKSFLQACHSDGATHVHAALTILRTCRPDLIPRLRIVTFAPARVIKPQQNEPLEVINLIKLEDHVVNPIGTGYHTLRYTDGYTQIVPHTERSASAHNFRHRDFINAAKPYFDEFMKTGHIYSDDRRPT